MTVFAPLQGLEPTASRAGVDLYWLPLGAGGSFVRLNGRIYEAIRARLERREPLALYHCALEVRLAGVRFVIELTPVLDGNGPARGVVCEGPVGSRLLRRWRLFRYEVHRWPGGVIPDITEAVASPRVLTTEPALARRLFDAVTLVPAHVWGRDELRTGEMWNSNSVIAWLIAVVGLDLDLVKPPPGGRAPGWDAGLVVARRGQVTAVPEQAARPPESARRGYGVASGALKCLRWSPGVVLSRRRNARFMVAGVPNPEIFAT